MICVEMVSELRPADGEGPRTITIHKGADWVNALEGVALFLREGAGQKIKDDGGTISPLLLPP